jgi:hypothetical protein
MAYILQTPVLLKTKIKRVGKRKHKDNRSPSVTFVRQSYFYIYYHDLFKKKSYFKKQNGGEIKLTG